MSTSRTAPRITICGILELGEHSAAGVTHVLSILGPNSPDPPEFAAFAPHRRLILRFHDVIEPQPDPVAAIRPRAWPNLLILEFGDALLGRNGEIVAAAGAIYRRVLARDPEFGDQMIDAGRDRELSAAYRETG